MWALFLIFAGRVIPATFKYFYAFSKKVELSIPKDRCGKDGDFNAARRIYPLRVSANVDFRLSTVYGIVNFNF